MKTAEELNALKEEFKALNTKLAELSEDELKQVTGGFTCGTDVVGEGSDETHGPTKRKDMEIP